MPKVRNDDNTGPPISAVLDSRVSLSAQDEALFRYRCGSAWIWIYEFLFKEPTRILGPPIQSLEINCLKKVEASFGDIEGLLFTGKLLI